MSKAGKPNASSFLSQNGIRYDGNQFPNLTPDQIVGAMATLNMLRTWSDDTGDFIYTTYAPEFVATADNNPNAFSPQWVAEQQLSMTHLLAAIRTGNLTLVHAMVDELERVRSVTGGSSFNTPCDFDIVSHAPTACGAVARIILAARADNNDTVVGTPIPSDDDLLQAHDKLAAGWFFTKAAYDALNAFGGGSVQSQQSTTGVID